MLPDQYFTPEKSDAAIRELVSRIGIDALFEKITVRTIDSGTFPALAVRLDPPFHTMLIKNRAGGFVYYRRLAAETGRLLFWAYADGRLPWILRDYPTGAEEALTGLFSGMALDPEFLAEQFQIPRKRLAEFDQFNRWRRCFPRRMLLISFLCMSGRRKIRRQFWSAVLTGVPDRFYQWIETLVTGDLQKYPSAGVAVQPSTSWGDSVPAFRCDCRADKRAESFL
jgi:hypothetical protein